MKTLIIIILVVLAIIAAAIGFFILMLYLGLSTATAAAAAGISYKNKTENDVWDYWEKNKARKWCELSEEEQEKMVVAGMIIANDVGTVTTEEKVRKMLAERLPITDPYSGFPCD